MKLLYFGAYNPNYPRNSTLRNGLQKQGWNIVLCRCDIDLPCLLQNWILLNQFLKIAHQDLDVIYLAERGQNVALLAWIISKITSKPLVVDFLYSRYDTQTEKKVVTPSSFSAKVLWVLDWLSLHVGDLVVTDTKSHISYYVTEFHLNPQKAVAIYLGADTNIYKPCPTQPNKKTKVFFWGSYTPSHGVDTIIRTANLTKDLNLEYVLIGSGPTYQKSIELAKSLELKNISFLPWMTQDKLASLILQADIVIGAVGKTPKSMRSICFKEYQGCAMRKPVITAETPAIKEVFTDKENILMCEAANPLSLSYAINELMINDSLRQKISNNGYSLIINHLSPSGIGAVLSSNLIKLLKSNDKSFAQK